MLAKMKKIVSLVLCTALLCSLMVVSVQADEAAGASAYIINEDFNSGAGVKHFTTADHGIANFADGHGKAMQLWCAANKGFDVVSGAITGSDGETAYTEPKDQVLSFDVYLRQSDVKYGVVVHQPDSTETNFVTMLFDTVDQHFVVDQSGRTSMLTTTAISNNQWNSCNGATYSPGKWHNVTVYFDFRDASSSATTGNTYVYLDGNLVRTHGIANKTKGISGITFKTFQATAANGRRAYVDNVKLHYVENATCYGKVSENNGNVVVNFTELLGDGPDVAVDYTGTTLTNTYTGEVTTPAIVYSNRKQLVLKPETALTPGAEYVITLPSGLLRWTGYGGTGTTPVAQPNKAIVSNVIKFTAAIDNNKVLMSEDGTNSGANSVFKPATTYQQITMGTDTEKGALKIDYDSAINSGNGKISFNNAHANNGVVGIDYAKTRSFEASLDFMVPEKAYYGGFNITLNSASSTEEAVAHFMIDSDGLIKCFPSNQVSGTASDYFAYYKVGEWNNLKVIVDTATNKINFYVNGEFMRDRTKANYSQWTETDVVSLLSVYYRPLAAANAKTTMYVDNICVKELCTGVSDVKIGTNEEWTDGVISATDENTVTVTFDGDLEENFAPNDDHITIYTTNSDNEIIKVPTNWAWDADTKTATVQIANLFSDTEYIVAVRNAKDSLGKTIKRYDSKFTTKALEISDLKIVDENGTAVVLESLVEGAKVYALPTVDGRGEAVVMIAQYNGGKLTDISPLTIICVEKDMEKTAELVVTDTNDLVLKAFIWDGIETIVPLVNAAVVENVE